MTVSVGLPENLNKNIQHYPVMQDEVLEFLQASSSDTVLDCTIGGAGHARRIVEQILPDGLLIGIDQDEEALLVANKNLKDFEKNTILIKGNFQDIDIILKELKITKLNGVLFDLGISGFQVNNPERGFSFRNEGPLDMRMDRNKKISAFDLINNLSIEEISEIIKTFGEERWSRRIARAIVRKRKQEPISNTIELAELIKSVVPPKYRYGRIHPATRTFQAFRIAVNRELVSLEKGLDNIVDFMEKGSKIVVISFHSLEDRIVKNKFRKFNTEGKVEILTKKPLRPKSNEININPRSRSAKMRVAQKN